MIILAASKMLLRKQLIAIANASSSEMLSSAKLALFTFLILCINSHFGHGIIIKNKPTPVHRQNDVADDDVMTASGRLKEPLGIPSSGATVDVD